MKERMREDAREKEKRKRGMTRKQGQLRGHDEGIKIIIGNKKKRKGRIRNKGS